MRRFFLRIITFKQTKTNKKNIKKNKNKLLFLLNHPCNKPVMCCVDELQNSNNESTRDEKRFLKRNI